VKPRILFVDDEPEILEGLQAMLYSMRSEWELSFAGSGAEALELLERTHQDVVVTDMRMPGMDGAQLLHAVQERSPETVRFILSGYSDQESVMRTVKLAHRYLSKPCPPAEMKLAIQKALRLRDIILDVQLKQVISRIDALPALPDLYRSLTMALLSEGASLQHIGDIIAQDVGMSASILRLVNSAFFGLPTRVASVQHAVKLLGTETIRVLILSLHLFSTISPRSIPGFSLKMLWEHSTRVACFARAIAEVENASSDERDDCFIAGMLHDVGKLVIATTMPSEYKKVLELVREKENRMYQAEQEVMKTTHSDVGAYLISLWGFNDNIVEAVCWHHRDALISCSHFSPTAAVAVANYFDHEHVHIGRNQGNSRGGTPSKRAKISHISFADRLEYLRLMRDWRSICARVVEKDH
jgi:HD-like signal output (HDOD) protein/ActR/RegA family two-component response regulator